MPFLTLLDLPMSEAKKNPNIHLLIRNKQMGITTWNNLTFLTYYATNDYS